MSDNPGSAVVISSDQELLEVVSTIGESTNIPYLRAVIPVVIAYVRNNKQDTPPSYMDQVYDVFHEKLMKINDPPGLSEIAELLQGALHACDS